MVLEAAASVAVDFMEVVLVDSEAMELAASAVALVQVEVISAVMALVVLTAVKVRIFMRRLLSALMKLLLVVRKDLSMQSSNGGVQNYEVNIPAGIESGKSIRLKGKGYPGVGGGEAGDLLLKVNVQDKPGYRREGRDVYTTVNIPFTTAVFGGEAKVHTIYGDVLCNIKPGTQSGTKIRLRGKGIVAMNNPSVHGDEYATVQIQVPTNLTPEARRKLKEFEQECSKTYRGRGFGNGSAA